MVTNNTNNRVWGCLDWFHDLRYFLFLVLGTYYKWGVELKASSPSAPDVHESGGQIYLYLFLVFVYFWLPSLPWILLYGFVIIPNEPYVKFCKDTDGGMNGEGRGEGHFTRAFLSNETETWECPPLPGSTWVRQSTQKDWQCNETYCTTDELASPESCTEATTKRYEDSGGYEDSGSYSLRCSDGWGQQLREQRADETPACCLNADYEGTYVQCEYCIPEQEILWVISIFAGIATGMACCYLLPFFFNPYQELERLTTEREQRLARKAEAKAKKEAEEKAKKDAEEKAKKEAEEKAKKDAEAAEHGVKCSIQ